MRIIGGYLKGRTLHPKGKITARPTTDFAKEALFNILENRIDLEGLKILDLFAGTGNITFEFISRGAGSVMSVEMQSECLANIKMFSQQLEVKTVQTIKSDVFKFLQKPLQTGFDMVFADPPYAHEKVKDLPQTVFESGVLNEGGWMIIEHGREIDFESYPFFVFHRKYGNVNFSFFEYLKVT